MQILLLLLLYDGSTCLVALIAPYISRRACSCTRVTSRGRPRRNTVQLVLAGSRAAGGGVLELALAPAAWVGWLEVGAGLRLPGRVGPGIESGFRARVRVRVGVASAWTGRVRDRVRVQG